MFHKSVVVGFDDSMTTLFYGKNHKKHPKNRKYICNDSKSWYALSGD